MSTHRPLRVGLTGGIASGKTSVAALFAALGVPVIDTDQIARDVVGPGTPGLEEVRQVFGDDAITADGRLDRARLRQSIFADPGLRERLETILHPRILREMESASDAAGGPYQILVIPLLVESNLRKRVDRVLVVDCNEEQQIARLIQRDGETRTGARRILAAQANRRDRLSAADDVIVNAGKPADLQPMIVRLDHFYRRLAASGDFTAAGLRLP